MTYYKNYIYIGHHLPQVLAKTIVFQKKIKFEITFTAEKIQPKKKSWNNFLNRKIRTLKVTFIMINWLYKFFKSLLNEKSF